MIGDVLNVKEQIPLLSVTTVDDVTYTEPIACPVEEVKDSSMYVGDSKILTQGTEGEAQVHAQVTYVNGSETQREILSSTTLREPTTTVKAVGTKEKPKTASTGSYSWPSGGGSPPTLAGGIFSAVTATTPAWDISCSYGAAIRAADGGTVTYAGYKLLRQSGHHYPRQRHPDLLRPQLVPCGLGGTEGVQGPADRQGGLYRTVYRRALSL